MSARAYSRLQLTVAHGVDVVWFSNQGRFPMATPPRSRAVETQATQAVIAVDGIRAAPAFANAGHKIQVADILAQPLMIARNAANTISGPSDVSMFFTPRAA